MPAVKPLLPPDEKFWSRYSSHFELPLAGMTSLFVHALVVGVLTFGGIALLFQWNSEANRPPAMDVVMLSPGGGDGGLEGLGSEPGLPGEAAPMKTEITTDTLRPDVPRPMSADNTPMLPDVPSIELDLPSVDIAANTSPSLLKDLENIRQDAADQAKREMPKIPTPKAGTGNPKGQGGLGGPGGGIGKGSKTGSGVGTGPLGGRNATKQEILAYRWRFTLAGEAKEHAEKLAAVGVIIAVPDPKGGPPDPKRGPYLFIRDLKRRPVDFERGDMSKHEDAVKWYNNRPESVRGLAQELRLPFVPPFVVMLLPKDREVKMAAEEARFAKENRKDLRGIQATYFDFQLRGGTYEPVAMRVE